MSSKVNFISKDLLAGLVVFLVALPLCLGVALASHAPLFSGILAGIIGGIVVGLISQSQTSVSGPAAGMTVVVITQAQLLGSFEAFLAAVTIAGAIQIILSICRMGFIAAYFPSSVIKGLLFAIGVILVLKQIPHILGHDEDPLGSKTFLENEHQNTFSELLHTFLNIHYGAAIIGVFSVAALILWDKSKFLKNLKVPAPVVVIVFAVFANYLFLKFFPSISLEANHLVQVPVATTLKSSLSFLTFPDFSTLTKFDVYLAGLTIAIVASLETLLNLEAIDKLDPEGRTSPPNRELLAQGVGNILGGLIGALPVTSVIVRSSVNINSGVKTKLSTIFHGCLILASVLLVPSWLNAIPLSALGAILLITGLKLANPQTVLQMWQEGKYQFFPFILTVIAIVLTDLLTGILIGLCISTCFILYSTIRRPIKKTLEKHASGDEVLHIELPNQISFFNKASLQKTLKNVAPGRHVLLDASRTDYLDPDILDLILEYQNPLNTKIKLSLKGFNNKHPQLKDEIKYVESASAETQKLLTPENILETLKEGNERFRKGTHLTRDVHRQLHATSNGQFPLAAVLSCIDSRSPVELIFDLSLGDVFSIRIAGNVISRKVLGSLEYSSAVAGAKLILVMGHTSCGAIKASADLVHNHQTAKLATGCTNLDSLVSEIKKSIDPKASHEFLQFDGSRKQSYYDELSYHNVLRTIEEIKKDSPILRALDEQGKIAIVGAMYNIKTGEVAFFQPCALEKSTAEEKQGLIDRLISSGMRAFSL